MDLHNEAGASGMEATERVASGCVCSWASASITTSPDPTPRRVPASASHFVRATPGAVPCERAGTRAHAILQTEVTGPARPHETASTSGAVRGAGGAHGRHLADRGLDAHHHRPMRRAALLSIPVLLAFSCATRTDTAASAATPPVVLTPPEGDCTLQTPLVPGIPGSPGNLIK